MTTSPTRPPGTEASGTVSETGGEPTDDRSHGGPDVAAAATRALDRLLSLQHPEGYWQGELETNVTMDAEDLLLRQFLGIRTARETAEAARWIRSQQRDDGTWANFYGGPGDLSTTVEAYAALRLDGDAPEERHMRLAASWIRENGGVEASRVFTRVWLALFGLWSWDDLPVMPPELVYLPRWFPLNVYDWACWARQTIVPLTVVTALRPRRDAGFDIPELRVGAAPGHHEPVGSWGWFFERLDSALHVYERRPVRGLRRAALRRAADWIIARQEADGSWGGIQPPWVYSVLALSLLGFRTDHPVLRKALSGLERFTIREETEAGTARRLEACQSPVWDTVLAMNALADAGLDGEHSALVSAADWVLDEEIQGPGDWAVRSPATPPSGWAFEFDNDGYPDTDDTAEVLLALRRVRHPRDSASLGAAVRRGAAWLTGMQSSDGGWGAFDVDNTQPLCARLPFCDFGAVIDPPTADVTAHVVEALCAEGHGDSDAVRRGVAWLLSTQEADGSWFGRWGANHLYGTAAVVPALVAAGLHRDAPTIRRAVAWVEARQNADGGWGEDLRSYDDPSWVGRGPSTASQTAWALLALLAAGERSNAVERGAAWLAATQRADGGWDEPQFTGTGFPGDFYIRYHLYRLVFPVSALGRYLGGAA